MSSERERLDHIRPAPDAAVHQDEGAIADRLDDLGQRVERRSDPVELTASVVRDDDPFNTCLDKQAPRLLP